MKEFLFYDPKLIRDLSKGLGHNSINCYDNPEPRLHQTLMKERENVHSNYKLEVLKSIELLGGVQLGQEIVMPEWVNVLIRN